MKTKHDKLVEILKEYYDQQNLIAAYQNNLDAEEQNTMDYATAICALDEQEAKDRRSKARDHLGGWFFVGCPDSKLLHEALDIASGIDQFLSTK